MPQTDASKPKSRNRFLEWVDRTFERADKRAEAVDLGTKGVLEFREWEFKEWLEQGAETFEELDRQAATAGDLAEMRKVEALLGKIEKGTTFASLAANMVLTEERLDGLSLTTEQRASADAIIAGWRKWDIFHEGLGLVARGPAGAGAAVAGMIGDTPRDGINHLFDIVPETEGTPFETRRIEVYLHLDRVMPEVPLAGKKLHDAVLDTVSWGQLYDLVGNDTRGQMLEVLGEAQKGVVELKKINYYADELRAGREPEALTNNVDEPRALGRAHAIVEAEQAEQLGIERPVEAPSREPAPVEIHLEPPVVDIDSEGPLLDSAALPNFLSQAEAHSLQEAGDFDLPSLELDLPARGSLSERYEVGNRGAETISGGVGDYGGISYGQYQLPSNVAGQLSENSNVMNFIRQSPFADDFEGLKLNSAEFKAKWVELATEEKTAESFAETQHAYVQHQNYDPLVAAFSAESGIDVNDRSRALQNVVWSTAVQHGGGTNLLTKALAATGETPANLADEELIRAIYEERGRVYETDTEIGEKFYPAGTLVRFRSSSAEVQQGVENRFESELSDALEQLEEEFDLREEIEDAEPDTGVPEPLLLPGLDGEAMRRYLGKRIGFALSRPKRKVTGGRKPRRSLSKSTRLRAAFLIGRSRASIRAIWITSACPSPTQHRRPRTWM